MTKNFKRFCIITILILVLYNILIFVIPYPHKSNSIFWTSWTFGLLYICIQPIIYNFSITNAKTIKSKIYGFPIYWLAFITLIIQLLITLLFLILGTFIVVPYWILIILESILLVFTLTCFIANTTYKETIEELENINVVDTKFMDNLKLEAKLILEYDIPTDIKNKLKVFEDEIKYSDPVSNDALKNIETDLYTKFIIVKNKINGKDYDTLNDDIDKLILILKERNQMAKANK